MQAADDNLPSSFPSVHTHTHIHAATSCSLLRATMWGVKSPFPSQATALSGLK